MDVELTADESAVLQQALKSYLSELRMEIGRTDDREFRDTLHHERDTLERVFAKLDEASGSTGDEALGVVRLVSIRWTVTDTD